MKTIMYFKASWCGPCNVLGPVMDKVSQNISVSKIDVDQDRNLVTQYHVKAVPTVIILEDNTEIRRFTGIKSENEILNLCK